MKKISIQVKDAAFDRIERGFQTEVYLPIEPKYTKMFVSENGRRNLLIDKQKGNAHINAVLDAFSMGYRLRIDAASIRRCCKTGVLNYKVKGVRISSGRTDWGAEEGKLCYVVILGEEMDV